MPTITANPNSQEPGTFGLPVNAPVPATTLQQDQATAANQGKPGYDVLGQPIATPTQPAREQTTFSSDTANTHIANNTTTLQTLKQTGLTVGGDGLARYSDSSFATAPSDAMQMEDGTWQAGGVRYAIGPSTTADPELTAIQKQISDMKAQFDATSKAAIDNIQKQFESLIGKQQDINTRSEASVNQSLLMGGSSRYAQISSTGQTQAMMSYGLSQIADLNMKEQSAIVQAQQAQEAGDMKLMDSAISIAQQARKDKQAAAQDLSEKLAAQHKAVTDAIAQARKDTEKQTQDLLTTARTNGASVGVLKAIQGAKTFAGAVEAAGKYGAGGAGIIGEYNYAKANGYTGSFSDYQNEDANRKAKATSSSTGGLQDMQGMSADTGAMGSGKSGDILSAAGLSIAAFNFLTQGTASMSRMNQAMREGIMKEAQGWAKKKGVDISTFQSQYKAYNEVLTQNIMRFNKTKIMEGEVMGTADALMSVISQSDLNNLKPENVAKLVLGEQVNDPTAMKYSFQIKSMANDLAGYFAAARGATSPELQDMRDAADVIKGGISTRSTQAFKDSVELNASKMRGVLQKSVDSARSSVWDLFGVGDKYTTAPVHKNADDIASDDRMAVGKIANFQNTKPENKGIIEKLHQLMPDASASEIAQQLGL